MMKRSGKATILWLLAAGLLAFPVLIWIIATAPSFTWPVILWELGRLAGLVGMVILFFQFVLASRIRAFEMDLGQDKLMLLHRKLGITVVVLLFLHSASLTGFDLISMGMLRVNTFRLLGIIAFLLMLVAAATAMYHQKMGLKYETWKYIHWINYVVFILVFIHSMWLGTTLRASVPLVVFWYTLLALFHLILLIKLVRFIHMRRNPSQVVAVQQATHDTWNLEFDGPKLAHKPGQYLMLALGRSEGISESHPFTISSAPGADRLSATPKESGDFTSTLGRTKPGDKAYIQGPYGVFTYERAQKEKLLFIAGGIGITPFLSMLRDMLRNSVARDVVLLWGNKTEQDIPFREEFARLETELEGLRVHHVMSHQDAYVGEKGFVDAEKIDRLVPDHAQRSVFLCGPPIMRDMLLAHFASIKKPKSDIHVEMFAL